MNGYFKKQIEALRQRHEALLQRPNEMQEETNGVIRRYVYPVLTRQHIPLEWRYDFNPATNPCCMERIGFNATMNSGALKWNGKYLMGEMLGQGGFGRPEVVLCHSRKP